MENIIEVNGLCKSFKSFELENVSFNVPAGSIVGVVGENGSGKTTTIKSILNVVCKSSGEIKLFGQDHAQNTKNTHEHIGVVYDDCCFHEFLTLKRLELIMAELYKNWDSDYYWQLIRRFSLEGKAKEKIKGFSRGMKMKLSLAVALAHKPKLLILDEATAGLDPIVRNEMLDIFLEFIENGENSILLSSHITSDIEKAADYLVFIHKGKVIINEEKDKLLEEYALLRCTKEKYEQLDKKIFIGERMGEFGFEALVKRSDEIEKQDGIILEKPKIDEIMYYTVKNEERRQAV